METSYDLTAVLSGLYPGGFLGIGRRPGLCVWGGAGDLLSVLAQSAWVIRVELAIHSTSHKAS